MFEKRLELKPLAKKDKKIAGIVGALKLAVNSVYGKSSDMQSWIYDRQLTMFTTITGELSLMMLIEAYELKGLRVISANTDGVTIMIKKSDLPIMDEINKWWCEATQFELERTDYSKIIFSTVNDYLAIKTNGEIKKKGPLAGGVHRGFTSGGFSPPGGVHKIGLAAAWFSVPCEAILFLSQVSSMHS
jgi:DNA polymerase elongation subunit (family B)